MQNGVLENCAFKENLISYSDLPSINMIFTGNNSEMNVVVTLNVIIIVDADLFD